MAKLNIKPGDKLTLTIRLDGRTGGGGDRALEKTASGTVEVLYPHFVLLRMQAGYRECFSYWALRRIMR